MQGEDAFSSCPEAELAPAGCHLPAASNPQQLNWVLYRFPGLIDADGYFVLGVTLTEPLPDTLWLGVPSYSSGRWQLTELESPQSVNYISLDSAQVPVSPAGNLWCMVGASGNSAANISVVKLELDAYCPPPLDLTASRGAHADRIVLNWTSPVDSFPDADFDSVVIERWTGSAEPFRKIAELDPGASSYEDIYSTDSQLPNLLPGNSEVEYRLRALRKGARSQPGPVAAGYRALPDVSSLVASGSASLGSRMDRVDLNWNPIADANGYVIEVRPEDAVPATFMALGAVPAGQVSFSHYWNADPPALDEQRYIYRIKALGDTCSSQHWTESNVGWRKVVPPTSVYAEQHSGGTQNNITWVPNSTAPAAYQLWRRDGEQNILVSTIGDGNGYPNSFTDTPPNAMPHHYWLRTDFHGDISLPSEEAIGYASPWEVSSLDFSPYSEAQGLADSPDLLAACSSESAVRYFYKSPPDSNAGFNSTVVGGSDLGSGAALALSGDLARLAFVSDSGKLVYAAALNPAPDTPADWQYIELQQLSNHAELSLQLFGGIPMLAVASDGKLEIAVASSVNPGSDNDWTIYELDLGPIASQPQLLDVDGVPALSWIPNGLQVMYARALNSLPQDAGSWQKYAICNFADGPVYLAATVRGGRPVLACNGILSEEAVTVWQTSLQAPDVASDWTSHTAWDLSSLGFVSDLKIAPEGPGLGLLVGASYDGLPGAYHLHSELSDPTLASDWIAEIVRSSGDAYAPSGGQLIDASGQLCAAFSSQITLIATRGL